MVELSIVIPVYNEEAGIGPVLDKVVAFKRQFEEQFQADGRVVEIIVVDDGSTDGTAATLARYPHPFVMIRQENCGYGAALKRGFESSRGQWIGFLDADGTYPPEEFFRLYDVVQQEPVDMVIGSRLSGRPSGMPAIRSLGNRSFSTLMQWASNASVADVASGMRLFRKELLGDMSHLPDGLHFTPAMTTWALHQHWVVKEIPIRYDERIGRSKLSVVQDGFRFADAILSVSWVHNPLKLFGLFGGVLLLAGLILVIQPTIQYVSYHRLSEWFIYRLLTVLLCWVVGLQSILCGILSASMAQLLHHKPLRSSVVERLLLQPQVGRQLHWLSLACMVAAAWLNAHGIWEYVTTSHVTEHWSRLLVGVVLVITAAQIFLFQVVLGYLQAMASRFGEIR